MPDQILAVYKNVLKPRGPAVDAGDLVLTNERLCFVQLAAWEPNVNANPLLTAVAGTLGGLGAAAFVTIGSVARQNPEIVKLLSSADKKRNMLWGMNLDERLLKTKSRWIIPIEEFSFEKSSDGVGVSVKGVGPLSKGNLTHFELYPTEGLDSALQSILETWKSHQTVAQAVEGYASKFLAPQLFLDALIAASLAEGKWRENEMLGDTDYVEHLKQLFEQRKYGEQCRVLRTLRNASAAELASLLHKQLVNSLTEKLKEKIRTEPSIWCGRIGLPLLFVCIGGCVVCALLPESNAVNGYFFLFMMLGIGAAIPALIATESFFSLRNIRSRLQEQGVNAQKLESDIGSTLCSFPISELRAAFSTDSTRSKFFQDLYSKPWKLQRETFQRFQGVVEPDLREALAAFTKAEGNRRKRSGLKGLIVGLVAGGIVWLWYVSIPPHGYGADSGPFIFVLAEAIFIVVCAIVAPACLISSILAFIASSRYGQVAKALS